MNDMWKQFILFLRKGCDFIKHKSILENWKRGGGRKEGEILVVPHLLISFQLIHLTLNRWMIGL